MSTVAGAYEYNMFITQDIAMTECEVGENGER